MLNIEKSIAENALLKLTGRIDNTTASEFEKATMEAVSAANYLTFDFSGVEYVSSAALRVILMAQKAMSRKGGMKLVNVSEIVMDVFEITGFADFLTIEN